MSLITTLRSRRRSWGPVALGALALGLTTVMLQSCVPVANVTADASPASTAHDGHYAGLAQQAADKAQTLCSRCADDGGSHCDGAPGEDCLAADPPPARTPVKPTDESSYFAALPPPARLEPGSLSRRLTAHKPAPTLPAPSNLSLNIRYCVYLK